jgi:hypothetical protein
MALESTQPVTEMNTGNIPGSKRRPARKADKFTAICEPIVWKMWEPRRHTRLWTTMGCHMDSFTFFKHIFILGNEIAKRYSAGLPDGRPGFNFRQVQEIFLFSRASRRSVRPTQPPIQWGRGAVSPGITRPGLEADHSPPIWCQGQEY